MAYGIEVRTSDGRELVTLLTPMFVLDFITSASGTKTYQVPSGKSLMLMKGTTMLGGSDQGAARTSISGNTLTWSEASVEKNIVVYAG